MKKDFHLNLKRNFVISLCNGSIAPQAIDSLVTAPNVATEKKKNNPWFFMISALRRNLLMYYVVYSSQFP